MKTVIHGESGKKSCEVARNALTRTVSGGFAIVQPGSQLSINAVEGFPLEDFSSDVNFPKDSICFALH